MDDITTTMTIEELLPALQNKEITPVEFSFRVLEIEKIFPSKMLMPKIVVNVSDTFLARVGRISGIITCGYIAVAGLNVLVATGAIYWAAAGFGIIVAIAGIIQIAKLGIQETQKARIPADSFIVRQPGAIAEDTKAGHTFNIIIGADGSISSN